MSDCPKRLSQYPLGQLRVACDPCKRRGSYSVARLGERHGAEIDLNDLLQLLTLSCQWQRPPGARGPRKYAPRCLAYFPDLAWPGPAVPAKPKLRVIGG